MPLMSVGHLSEPFLDGWFGICPKGVEEAVDGPACALEQEDQKISPVSQFCYFPLVLAQNIICLSNFFMPLNSDLHRLTTSYVTAYGWGQGCPSVGTTPHYIIPHPSGLWGG